MATERTLDGMKHNVNPSTREERGLGKNGSFKPSAPIGYVRPKAVAVPKKTK